MTILEALFIQFKFAIIMIVSPILWAGIKNKTVKEFLHLDTYPTEVKLMLFGFLFILWFGVITYYRYIFQWPLMGVWSYIL